MTNTITISIIKGDASVIEILNFLDPCTYLFFWNFL